MISVGLFLFLVSGIAQTTVQIRKPDGSYWSGTLRPHPRLFVTNENASAVIDPDGDGPLRAPRAIMTNDAYRALWNRADWGKSGGSVANTFIEARFYFPALLYMMDHASSWSKSTNGERRNCTSAQLADSTLDPTRNCLKWWAIDNLVNTDTIRPDTGICDYIGAMCSWNSIYPFGKTDYHGSMGIPFSMAYSILRADLTTEQRQKVATLALNGLFVQSETDTIRLADGRGFHGDRLNGYIEFETDSSATYGAGNRNATWYGDAINPALVGTEIITRPRPLMTAVDDSVTTEQTPEGAVAFAPEKGLEASEAFCKSSTGKLIPSTWVSGSTPYLYLSQKATASYSTDVITVSTGARQLGVVVGDPIIFRPQGAAVFPAPLVPNTTYYVHSYIGKATLKISATSDGPPIDITTNGSVYLTVPDRTGTCYADAQSGDKKIAWMKLVSIGTHNGTSQAIVVNGNDWNTQFHLWVWPVPAWTNQFTGYLQAAKWHGNVPPYAASKKSRVFRLATAISANATSIAVNSSDLSAFNGIAPPFMVAMRSFGGYGGAEIIKVTARVGSVLTVERGYHGTLSRPRGGGWPVSEGGDAYVFEGPVEDMQGWNNRNMSRSSGFMAALLAFADDDERAARTLKEATDFFYENAFPAEKYFGIFMNSLGSYDYSRMIQFWTLFTLNIRGATLGAVDYTQQPWMKDFMLKRPFYLHLPMLEYFHINWGITADNCKAFGFPGDAGCEIPLWMAQSLYPDDSRSGMLMDYASRLNQNNAVKYPKGPASYEYLRYSDRGPIYNIFYSSGSEPAVNYSTLPKTLIYPDSTDPNNIQYGLFSHRSAWKDPNASIFAAAAFTGFGEKFMEGPHIPYVLGKKVLFIGQHVGLWPLDSSYWGGEGNGYDDVMSRFNEPIAADLTDKARVITNTTVGTTTNGIEHGMRARWDRRLNDSTVALARAVSTNRYNLPKDISTYRTNLVFKEESGAAEVFAIFDELTSPEPANLRTQIGYHMDGGSRSIQFGPTSTLQEGYTTMTGSRVTSTYPDGDIKLVTDLPLGSGYKNLIGTHYDYIEQRYVFRIGTRCSVAQPCALQVGGQTYSLTEEASVRINTAANSTIRAWFNPADGRVHIGWTKGSPTLENCTGAVCETSIITGIPDGSFGVLNAEFNASGSLLQGLHSGSNAYDVGFYAHPNGRFVFVGDKGVTNFSAVAVHRFAAMADNPGAATEIPAISEGWLGVEIPGTLSRVAIVGKGATTRSGATFTTTHAGTGRYVVAGLTPATYTIRRNNAEIASVPVYDGEFSLTFSSLSGNIEVTQGGPAPLQIITATLPKGKVGSPYSEQLSAVGGTPPYQWNASAPLPPGLTFTPAGVLSGTPTTLGNFALEFSVSDSAGNGPVSRRLPLMITPALAELALNSTSLPDAIQGNPYAASLSAIGGVPPYKWTSASLPSWLTLSSSGILNGTPTAEGDYPIEVSVSDSNTPEASAPASLPLHVHPPGVIPPIEISSVSLLSGRRFQPYSYTFSASGGVPPYTWSLDSGTLPPGLSLSQSGVLSGTPTETGVFSGVVRAGDETREDTGEFSLEIEETPSQLDVTVSAFSREAIVRYGEPGLRSGTPCSVQISPMAYPDIPAFSATDTGELGRRYQVVRNLPPATSYKADVSCGVHSAQVFFSTEPSRPARNTRLNASIAAPIGKNITTFMIETGSDPNSLTQTAQVPCTGICRATVSASSRTIIFYRFNWLDASGNIVASSRMEPYLVP